MNIIFSSSDIAAYVQLWRYAGWVLGIEDEFLPESLEDQEEFMTCSMLHQGSPEAIDFTKLKEFMDAFARAANKSTLGLLPLGMAQTFLYQMTRYLNGHEYAPGLENLGDGHWSVRLIRVIGRVMGTAIPRGVPFAERALFAANTAVLRRRLARRGTPTGHGAGSGEELQQDDLTPKSACPMSRL